MKYREDAIPAGEKIRVLIVDDSSLMRRIISRTLAQDPELEVVGTACDGLDGLEKVRQLRPHVVTLDVELPQLDGVAALRQIMARFPATRVVMLSSSTARGAQITIDVLLQGASDYVTKPSMEGDAGMAGLSTELTFKIKQFFPRSVEARPATPTPPRYPTFRAAPEICALGVSTGGPSALLQCMPMFPAAFPLPILIVQHMPAVFTQLLAERLDRACSISVVEGEDGMDVRAGRAIVAPGGSHMRVVQSAAGFCIKLDEGPKENSCRPAVDVLFRSIAETCEGRAIAAVLTGMGSDGLLGARLLRARGGTILAQDRASSIVWGMPGAIVDANLAHAVLPLESIVPEIVMRAGAR